MLRSVLVTLLASTPVFGSASQDVLDDRLRAADASRTLRVAFFEGRGDPPLTIEQAFSHLAGGPVAELELIDARRRRLASRRDERAATLLATLLDAPGGRLERLRAILTAESEADGLEEQLLAALSVGLERAPGFTERAVANALLENDEPAARSRLRAFQRAALRRMSVPGDGALAALVDAELQASDVPGDAAHDRLTRALPLLDSERSQRVLALLGDASPRAAGASQVIQAIQASPDESEPSEQAVSATTGRILETAREIEASARARRQELTRRVDTLAARASTLESDFAGAQRLSLLDEKRNEQLQTALEESNELIRDIRGELKTLGRLRRAHAVEDGQITRELSSGEPTRAESEAFRQLEAAFDARQQSTSEGLTALLSVQIRALTVRRALSPLASAPMTSQVFVDELVSELEGARLWLERELREDARRFASLPERATNLYSLGELLNLSIDLLLLAVAWIYVRNQAPRWMRHAVNAREDDSNGRIHRIGRFATDAAGALVLHRLVLPRSELLALVALMWVAYALVRCIPATIRVLLPLLGQALDPLETDNALSADVMARAERTASWFLWWWILSEILEFVAVPLLQADRLLQITHAVSLAVFTLLLLVSFWSWSQWIRRFIANLADQSPLTTQLARPSRSKVWRIVRAAIGSLYILLRLVFWALVDRGWLTRSGTHIVLSQLQLAGADAELLDAPARDRIRETENPLIERTHEIAVVMTAFEAWKRERRRGVIAIIGDRGKGKSVLLDQIEQAVNEADKETPCTRLSVPRLKRSASFRDRLSWLCEPLAIDVPKNSTKSAIQKTLVQKLETMPSRVLLVDDLHFLLRRTVGGLDALGVALNIVQACADEHFWVLTLHRPAWRYVNGASTAIELAFRDQIDLSALDPDELGELLVNRTRAAGYAPEFRTLLSGRRPHAEKDALEQKARRLYWRLASQSSLDNPLVMLDFWLSSLGATNGKPDDDGEPAEIPMYLYAGGGDKEIERMSDETLFLLTALLVHDGLGVEDLADVLNIEDSAVRVTCQHLESLGVVVRQNRTYWIAARWQPSVVRVLDRRNFAHR